MSLRVTVDYPEGSEKLKLVARFSQSAAQHLEETPLAEDHRTKRQSNGEVEVSAMVQDTSQLRWWLLRFGDQVEVLKPRTLRAELAATIRAVAARYASSRRRLCCCGGTECTTESHSVEFFPEAAQNTCFTYLEVFSTQFQ